MATYYGFNPPFLGGPQNILSRQEDEKLIKNDLLQLILTVPGERVNRPEFGTPLRSHLFEQNTEADLAILENRISEAIAANEPRVRILALRLTRPRDEHSIFVQIIAELINDPQVRLTIEKFISSPIDPRR